MGTTEDVDQAEAIAIVEAMEDHIIALAEEQHFMGVMTTNTNPLTRVSQNLLYFILVCKICIRGASSNDNFTLFSKLVWTFMDMKF